MTFLSFLALFVREEKAGNDHWFLDSSVLLALKVGTEWESTVRYGAVPYGVERQMSDKTLRTLRL